MSVLHRISHWLGWNPCELVSIEHTYYRGTRTPCKGFCFSTPGEPQCEWKAIIRCRVCGKEQVVR
jgi:hypothetical protein